MQLIKLAGADCPTFLNAVRSRTSGKASENSGKKQAEAATEIIERELLRLRELNVDALANKDVVIVQCDGKDVLKISRKESMRFDAKAFALAHPDLAIKFTRPMPATYFDSLES